MHQTISIEGMGCDHCVAAVRSALEALDGVRVEQVRIGSVRLVSEPGEDAERRIDGAIREAGYEPISRQVIGE